LKPNDPYRGCTAPLTSKRHILYIYSTNIGTEYFKHGIYSPFFPLQNAVCFIILTFGSCIIHFYIQSVLKLKKNRYQKFKRHVSALFGHHQAYKEMVLIKVHSFAILMRSNCLEYPLYNQAFERIHSRPHNLRPSVLGYYII